jgi:hypothetical protein
MTLTVTYPTFNADEDLDFKDVYLIVQYDHHGGGDGPVAFVDSMTSTGPGLGLLPWKQANPTVVTTFEQSTTFVDDLTYSAKVVTNSTLGGVRQTVAGLTPGRTYTFSGRVRHAAGSNQDFVIRMRRGSGDGVIATATVSVPTATWTDLTVTGEVDQERVIFDIRKSTSGTFYVDTCELKEGQAAASWGAIQKQLLDDLQTDHAAETPPYNLEAFGLGAGGGPWLDFSSVTVATDSDGNAWSPATVEYRAKRGKKFSQINADGLRNGYEWLITDIAGSQPTYEVFNPYDWSTRTGGVGTPRTGTGVPELRYGAGVTSGPIVESPAGANRVHVEGEGGKWRLRTDTSKIAAFGTRMLYDGDTNLLGGDTLGQVADQLLDERTVPTTALKVNIEPVDEDTPTPYVHFFIGDTYPIDLTGDFTGDKRVVKITTDFTPGYGRYVVEFDNTSYSSNEQKAIAEAVRRLLEKVDTLDAPADTSTPDVIDVTTSGAIEPSFLVAASDARTEIQEAADFVCDGVGDEEEIELAIAEATALGAGRVALSEGTFTRTFTRRRVGCHLPRRCRRFTRHPQRTDPRHRLRHDLQRRVPPNREHPVPVP